MCTIIEMLNKKSEVKNYKTYVKLIQNYLDDQLCYECCMIIIYDANL